MPSTACICGILLSYLVAPLLAQHFGPPHYQHTQVISTVPASGPSIAQWTSEFNDFDAPHLSSINDTSFEWWWFGAIDATGATAHVIFFTSTTSAFPLSAAPNGTVLGISVQTTWPNGTFAEFALPAETATFNWGDEGDAVIVDYQGPGVKAGFTSSPDLSHYTIFLDAPAYELSGTLEFERTAPSHSCCTASTGPGQPLQVLPHLAWDNALPAASVSVDMSVKGSPLSLVGGLGYHDHNWGDKPFLELINFWYWGHAQLGPFTIVWFEGQTPDGTTYSYGYLAEDDKLLLSTCNVAEVTIRPYGNGAQYPPTLETYDFDYLIVEFDLQDQGTFVANVSGVGLNKGPSIYHFWIGEASGGWKDGEVHTGLAEFEEFTLVGASL